LPNPAQTIFLSLSPGPGAVWVGAIDVQVVWMFPMAMPITLILVDLGAVSFFLAAAVIDRHAGIVSLPGGRRNPPSIF